MNIWQTNQRLIDIWEMKEYCAVKLAAVSDHITTLHFQGFEEGDDGLLKPSSQVSATKAAKQLSSYLEEIGLIMTSKSVRRLINEIPTLRADNINDKVDEIERRLWDELREINFLYLNAEERRFFDSPAPFGEKVRDAFPLANAEIIEASKCYALERSAACVFHLVRSAEIAVKCLMSHMGVEQPAKDGDRNWSGMLKLIKEKLDTTKANPISDDWSFCEKAYAFLQAFKNPLRNNTMHVDVFYDQMSAKAVYDALNGMMSHLATKLKE